MKTIFKFLLVTVFLSFFAQNAKAADTLNPCWTMYYPHDPEHGYFNPDSVLYDSCFCKDRLHEGCDSIYAKQWYEITFFNNDPFGYPQCPEDTIIETSWHNLDSSYVELRNMFQNVENKFGSFILRKKFPEVTDSQSLGSRTYLVKFKIYCNIFSVVSYLYNTNLLFDVYYKEQVTYIPDLGVEDDNSENIILKIYPNPAKDFIKIDFQKQFNARKIQIISLEGIIILETEYKELIDISNLPTGLYFIRCGDIVRSFIVYH